MGPGFRQDDTRIISLHRCLTRHPEERVARLEGSTATAVPCILRGSLRSHLRMTAMGLTIHSRSRDMICPSLAIRFALSLRRGRRESRRRAAPAVPCAILEKRRTRAYRFSGGTPAFPAQWLYGLYVLSPARLGFVVTVFAKKRELLKDETPAIGRPVHTISPSAAARSSRAPQRPPHLTATPVTIA